VFTAVDLVDEGETITGDPDTAMIG
jgi:hypothetical protein